MCKHSNNLLPMRSLWRQAEHTASQVLTKPTRTLGASVEVGCHINCIVMQTRAGLSKHWLICAWHFHVCVWVCVILCACVSSPSCLIPAIFILSVWLVWDGPRACVDGPKCGRRNGGRRGGAVLEGPCSVVRCAELVVSLHLLRWRTAPCSGGL